MKIRGGKMQDKKQLKDQYLSAKITKLNKTRLVLLAGERQWTVSHLVENIISDYCNAIFKENSIEYKE